MWTMPPPNDHGLGHPTPPHSHPTPNFGTGTTVAPPGHTHTAPHPTPHLPTHHPGPHHWMSISKGWVLPQQTLVLDAHSPRTALRTPNPTSVRAAFMLAAGGPFTDNGYNSNTNAPGGAAHPRLQPPHALPLPRRCPLLAPTDFSSHHSTGGLPGPFRAHQGSSPELVHQDAHPGRYGMGDALVALTHRLPFGGGHARAWAVRGRSSWCCFRAGGWADAAFRLGWWVWIL